MYAGSRVYIDIDKDPDVGQQENLYWLYCTWWTVVVYWYTDIIKGKIWF